MFKKNSYKKTTCPDAQAYGKAIRNLAIAAGTATVLVGTGVVLTVKAFNKDTEEN